MDVESAKQQNSNGTSGAPSSSLAARRSGCGKRRKRTLCLSIIAVLLALAILLLVLALTVFKAKRPVIAVRSVSLGDFDLSFDITRFRLFLNLTLHVSLLVTNPNWVGFQYSASSALLKYDDRIVVGEVPVPAGKIGPRQTLPMNVSLTVMADRLLSDSSLISQLISGGGTLHFSTSTRVSGHVRILFKIHVVSYSTCDVYVDISRRNIANQTCHYKYKL